MLYFQKEFDTAVSYYKQEKKDRCGEELTVQDTNTFVANLRKKIQLSYSLVLIRKHWVVQLWACLPPNIPSNVLYMS